MVIASDRQEDVYTSIRPLGISARGYWHAHFPRNALFIALKHPLNLYYLTWRNHLRQGPFS